MKVDHIYFKRALTFVFVTLAVVLGISTTSFPSDVYPSKPVQILVGYAAGGTTDVGVRAIAPGMGKILGVPVIVANKPGASAAIMMESIKSSAPDGYTLGAWASGAISGPHIRSVPYHFFDDFTQVCQILNWDYVLAVNAEAPWKTAKELVDYGKKNPGKLRWGSSGIGGGTHMLSARFGLLNNFEWESVPFDGDAPAANALLGKHIDVVIQTLSACGPLGKAGRLRFLGAFTQERSRLLPDVPTMKEQGLLPHEYKFGVAGLCAPKNLPAGVEEKIASAANAACQDPDVARVLEKIYLYPTFRAGQDLIKSLKQADMEELEIMKRLGMKIFTDAYK